MLGVKGEVLELKTRRITWVIVATALSLSLIVWAAQAGPSFQKCSIPPPETPRAQDQRSSQPECGLELTSTDKPVLLGYPQGACFRATCPGIWDLIHTTADQASYRRRLFTYRQHTFRGYWDLKDQGVIKDGAAPVRELFLVLPEDLIEFKLTDPDCYARIEIRNLGYMKTGNLHELHGWLAHNSCIEKAELSSHGQVSGPVPFAGCLAHASCLDQACRPTIGRMLSVDRAIDLPFAGP
jgi:hypothetical protein